MVITKAQQQSDELIPLKPPTVFIIMADFLYLILRINV